MSIFEQFLFLKKDINRLVGKRKIRLLHIWMSRLFIGIFLYRFERFLFLLIGKSYEYLRVFLLPIISLLQAYSNLELNYKTDIKGGLLILHPSPGIVISALAIIRENLTLTGGNIIGAKPTCKIGEIVIGNNVTLGANAVVIGPVKIANDISIGAMALVNKDCDIVGATLVGVPAKIKN